MLLNYRKTHLWGEYEKDIFTPGDCLAPVIEISGIQTSNLAHIEGWKVGFMICFDVEFPEVCRSLALKGKPSKTIYQHLGAEALVAIAACSTSSTPLKMVPIRAEENNVFAGYINRVKTEKGTSFQGGIDGN